MNRIEVTVLNRETGLEERLSYLPHEYDKVADIVDSKLIITDRGPVSSIYGPAYSDSLGPVYMVGGKEVDSDWMLPQSLDSSYNSFQPLTWALSVKVGFNELAGKSIEISFSNKKYPDSDHERSVFIDPSKINWPALLNADEIEITNFYSASQMYRIPILLKRIAAAIWNNNYEYLFPAWEYKEIKQTKDEIFGTKANNVTEHVGIVGEIKEPEVVAPANEYEFPIADEELEKLTLEELELLKEGLEKAEDQVSDIIASKLAKNKIENMQSFLEKAEVEQAQQFTEEVEELVKEIQLAEEAEDMIKEFVAARTGKAERSSQAREGVFRRTPKEMIASRQHVENTKIEVCHQDTPTAEVQRALCYSMSQVHGLIYEDIFGKWRLVKNDALVSCYNGPAIIYTEKGMIKNRKWLINGESVDEKILKTHKSSELLGVCDLGGLHVYVEPRSFDNPDMSIIAQIQIIDDHSNKAWTHFMRHEDINSADMYNGELSLEKVYGSDVKNWLDVPRFYNTLAAWFAQGVGCELGRYPGAPPKRIKRSTFKTIANFFNTVDQPKAANKVPDKTEEAEKYQEEIKEDLSLSQAIGLTAAASFFGAVMGKTKVPKMSVREFKQEEEVAVI